jgi:hypothetical protein
MSLLPELGLRPGQDNVGGKFLKLVVLAENLISLEMLNL